MKVSKASAEFANRIFRLCVENGTLNEEKFTKALDFLRGNKPNDYRGVLIALRKLVRLDVDKRTVHVESASDLTSEESARIAASLTKKHGDNLIFHFSVNPALIAGLKVRIGSQVYDGSVLSKVNRLAS